MISDLVRGGAAAAVLFAAVTQACAAATAPPNQLYAATVESGGYKAGCVRFVPTVDRSGQFHVVQFGFFNECGRKILVRIGKQYGTDEGGWGQVVSLDPGAALQGKGHAGNWIAIDQREGRQLFTVMQAEPARRVPWPSLAGCKPRPRPGDAPCPPMISVD